MLLKGPEITDQKCIDDMLMIHGGFPIPNICGTNTNQHCKFFFILLVSRHSCLRAPPPKKKMCKQKQFFLYLLALLWTSVKPVKRVILTKIQIKNPNKEGNLLPYVTLRFFLMFRLMFSDTLNKLMWPHEIKVWFLTFWYWIIFL